MNDNDSSLNAFYAEHRRRMAAIYRLSLFAGRLAAVAKALPTDRLECLADDLSAVLRKARPRRKTRTPAKAAIVEDRPALRLAP